MKAAARVCSFIDVRNGCGAAFACDIASAEGRLWLTIQEFI